MAQPILTYTPHVDSVAERQARLHAAVAQHADALIAVCAFLQELQDGGALDLMRGIEGSRPEIITALSEAAHTTESIAALRNIVSLFRILGAIDPDILHGVAEIVTRPAGPEPNKPGVWKTLRRLGSKESLRAIGAAAYGLQVFGHVLIANRPQRP